MESSTRAPYGGGEEGKTVQRCPVDQFQPTVFVLDQGGAAFHPVPVVDVQNPADFAHFRLMDMAADDAVEAAPAGLAGQGGLEAVDRLHRFLYLPFRPLRE